MATAAASAVAGLAAGMLAPTLLTALTALCGLTGLTATTLPLGRATAATPAATAATATAMLAGCTLAMRVVGARDAWRRRVRGRGLRTRRGEIRISVMRCTACAATAARRAARAAATPSTATATATAPILGATTRILVGSVFTRLATFAARCMRALFDLELRRRQELDRALQQFLDVSQQRNFVRRHQ